MNEEEKKAIEKIKEIIECFYCFPNPTCIELKDCDCSTLEIALELIEKLQKENEELKNQEATVRKINELLVQRYSNSISVQKVKDKIEELKNNIDYLKQFNDWNEKDYTNEDIINNVLEVLQELLEGSNK